MDRANSLSSDRAAATTTDEGLPRKVELRELLHMSDDATMATMPTPRFSSSSNQLPTIAEEIPPSPMAKRSQQESQQQRRRVVGICSSSKSSSADEDDDDEMQANFEKLCSRASACQPLMGILSSFIACRGRRAPPGAAEVDSPSSNSAAPRSQQRPGRELLDMSKRQQSALDDKQETIDMLEWQLEQLHSMAMKERAITGICGPDDGDECCALSENCVVGALKNRHRNDGNFLPPRRSFAGTKSLAVDNVSMDMEITATELLLEMTVVRATLSIRRFCKVFMKQMEMSGYSVLRALGDLEPKTVFAKKEHTAFALESRINKALFHCFENESFDRFGITKILNPSQRALSRLEEFQRMKLLDVADAVNPAHGNFEPDFLSFCENKTHDMWGLFPWTIIFKTSAERNNFTSAFINACKGVWLLHRLAYSMNPAASIIRVGRGMEINLVYVEPVVNPLHCKSCKKNKVEFMVMPGFRTQKKTVKCAVYAHTECK